MNSQRHLSLVRLSFSCQIQLSSKKSDSTSSWLPRPRLEPQRVPSPACFSGSTSDAKTSPHSAWQAPRQRRSDGEAYLPRKASRDEEPTAEFAWPAHFGMGAFRSPKPCTPHINAYFAPWRKGEARKLEKVFQHQSSSSHVPTFGAVHSKQHYTGEDPR